MQVNVFPVQLVFTVQQEPSLNQEPHRSHVHLEHTIPLNIQDILWTASLVNLDLPVQRLTRHLVLNLVKMVRLITKVPSWKKLHLLLPLQTHPLFHTKAIFYINYTVKPVWKRTSWGPAFVFGIDRCSVYTGWIYIDFLYWDFIQNSIYTGFRFIQGSVNEGFTVSAQIWR